MAATATLSLEWSSERTGHKEGWCIVVCGPNITSTINLSTQKFVPANTAPYPFHSNTGTGPIGWMITPKENPILAFGNGGRPQNPPVGYVTDYLQILQGYGFKVVGTHSLSTGENNSCPILSWTLQKKY